MITVDYPVDKEVLMREIERWFHERDFESRLSEQDGVYVLAARKSSPLRQLTGTSRALVVAVRSVGTRGTQVNVRAGRWADNAWSLLWLFTPVRAIYWLPLVVGWSFKLQSDLEKYIRELLPACRVLEEVRFKEEPPTEPVSS